MKNKKILSLLVAPLLMIPVLTSCGGSTDPNTINIICYTAGYGGEWIDEIKEQFLVTHPDVTVNINKTYSAQSLIESHLGSRNNDDDLYISVSTNWKSYAAQGQFAVLDDFLEESVDGVKVKDKVADEYEDSIYFTRSDGTVHSYRLPWTSGMGGIYYNKVMFEANGWSIPTTFDQLVTLCETINSARLPVAGGEGDTAVKPFAYSGTNTDYFDYTVFNWWGQLAGVDNIKEFLKYENASNYDVNSNTTYNALKTATTKWNTIFGNSSNYVANSNNKSADDAQKEFINGYAAMMMNGDWLYNESLAYTRNGAFDDTFELGMMKTPVLSEAIEANVNTAYTIGEDQYIAIPASSKRQELAKEFIKAIISNEGCKTFTEKANGFLAYDSDLTAESVDDAFIKDVITLRNSYANKFTSFSSNRKYLCNYIDIWCQASLRPFLGVLNGTQTNLDTAFSRIATTATSQWSYWTTQSR